MVNKPLIRPAISGGEARGPGGGGSRLTCHDHFGLKFSVSVYVRSGLNVPLFSHGRDGYQLPIIRIPVIKVGMTILNL